ncbi:MAG: Xaa-Pro peptidase family protein [Desulfobacteraceae bacterium]|nr:Xaa-Pro peptidase family protein [Desulfobacteraceae bacterium]
MLKHRRSRLKPFFEEHRLDAILITNLANIRYLCGFSGSDGVLLLAREEAWFLCDSRYTTQAADEVRGAEVREYSAKYEAICSLISDKKIRRFGFEATHMLVSDFRQLSERLAGCELVGLGAALDSIRSCKDKHEIEALGRVAALASASLGAVLASLAPGIRESDIALELEIEIRRRGADARAFDFIVASGERGAMPHGKASDKVLRTGELVTIDFGAVKDGYHSDETVTVAVGRPSARGREIHDIVRQAHDRAVAAVRPGISCRDLDAVARDYIREQGYDSYFGHGLGHGVGLEIHEKPVVSPRGDAVVEEGMVFTIEPGIYVPGFGGVRIEDTVAVTADGCVILTQAPKDLILS